MAMTASARLMRYSMSLGVSSVVPGMGSAPSLNNATIATYHSGMRGSIMNTRSPFLMPSSRSELA